MVAREMIMENPALMTKLDSYTSLAKNLRVS
jgi:hypothetical protein